jgi:hypothetical protein
VPADWFKEISEKVMHVRIWPPTRSQRLSDAHKAILHIREHLECADWCRGTSQKVMHARIWPQPAAGTVEMATRPFSTSVNFKLADGGE